MSKEEVHSFFDLQYQREQWWNEDYLRLLVKRWDLERYSSMLDVGVGLGHWSRLLLSFLQPDFHFTGVDIEEYWLKNAPNLFYKTFPDVPKSNFTFVNSNAEDLKLNSELYDVVTCQTLLMHLNSPLKAMEEMKRVTRKNGIIICIEPINLFNRLEISSANLLLNPSERVILYDFWMRLHEGKRISGLGDNDIGMYLPALFYQCELENIKCYQNDKLAAEFVQADDEAILLNDKDVNFARIGGASEKLINDMQTTLKTLNLIKSSNKNLFSSGTMNMIICSGNK